MNKHYNECPMNETFGDKDKPCTCPKDKTEQIRENGIKQEFYKRFGFSAFTWNGDNKTGRQFASRQRRIVLKWWLQKLEEQKQEAHETNNGWCCACDYDQIELNRRLEEQKQAAIAEYRLVMEKDLEQSAWAKAYRLMVRDEMVEEIEKLRVEPDKFRGLLLGRDVNEVLDTVLTIIKKS